MKKKTKRIASATSSGDLNEQSAPRVQTPAVPLPNICPECNSTNVAVSCNDCGTEWGARGWKLVPVEPTPQMIEAGCISGMANEMHFDDLSNGVKDTCRRLNRDAYRAMLAAAPSKP